MRRQPGSSKVSLGHMEGWLPKISTEIVGLLKTLNCVREQAGCRGTAVSSSSQGPDSGFFCSVIEGNACLEKNKSKILVVFCFLS